jgi:multidrug efflux pump subunit AcrA (membrane-fusion protein)
MNRYLRLAIILVAGSTLALALGACSKRQKGPPQFPPAAVQSTLAVKMDTPVVISAFGNTKDQASVDVVPQVSGMLVKTFILDGAIVTNGQQLRLLRDSSRLIKLSYLEFNLERIFE